MHAIAPFQGWYLRHAPSASRGRARRFIDSDHDLSVDNLHWIRCDPVSRDIQCAPGSDIIFPAVSATGHDLSIEFRSSERHSVVKTTIVHRVNRSIHIEERDVL